MFRKFRKAENAGLDPAQLQTLAAANHFIENGKPAEAAPLLAGLAAGLEQVRPRRAANIHARAAHAFADAGQPQAALAQARGALSMFIKFQMVQRTPVFYTNIRRKFTDKGMLEAAKALENEFGRQVAVSPALAAGLQTRPRGVLPTNCPKCGAPIHAADAEWIDEITVECDYCGSAVRSLQS